MNNQLLNSRFIQLQKEFPEDAPVRISIELPCGPSVVIRLSDLRELLQFAPLQTATLLSPLFPLRVVINPQLDPGEWGLLYPTKSTDR